MFSQQSTIFPKQIKIDDYQPQYQNNKLIILQSSNLLLGSGCRTSLTSIILSKSLHYMIQQNEIQLKSKSILQLGCGVGLLGIYLSTLGCKVMMIDGGGLKDLVQRNVSINRNVIKGKVQFATANWKKINCTGHCQETNQSENISTSSSDKYREVCLYHLKQHYDLTIVCQCGGLNDLQYQLQLMGKQGMILAFMKRQNYEDGLDERNVEEYLADNGLEYQKIQTYHPDYVDYRIAIFRIFNNKIIEKQIFQEKFSQLNLNSKGQ